jgi:hypothetical protein
VGKAPFSIVDWVPLADVGEHQKQRNGGSESLALHDVRQALLAGCRALIRWGKDGQLMAEMQPPAAVWRKHRRLEWNWPFIRVDIGVQQPPRVLRVRLSSSGRRGEAQGYLWRADAERYGLLPASEALQAEPQAAQFKQQPEQPKRTGKEWIAEVWSNKDKRDELLAMGITKAGHLLESQPPSDGKPVKHRSAEKILHALGYPKRGSPKQHPTK